MKKYKLVKSYPGSPVVGTISSPKGKLDINDGMHYFTGIWFDPKAYPDYWEEIIEKDYEILSFICNQNLNALKYGEIISLLPNGQYQGGQNNSITSNNGVEGLLNLTHWSIHSVKRLSDGEIFTVGDNVTMFKENSKIKSFRILYNNEFVTDFINSCSTTNIKSFNKIKIPLFTTEDGVDIFEGDIVWHTNLNFDKPYSSPVKKADKPYIPVKGLYSSYEKAEEYIIMNKPCLSVNQVKTVFTIAELKELVKIKLNK